MTAIDLNAITANENKRDLLVESFNEKTSLTWLWSFLFGWLWFAVNGYLGACLFLIGFNLVIGVALAAGLESTDPAAILPGLIGTLLALILPIPLAYRCHRQKAERRADRALLLA